MKSTKVNSNKAIPRNYKVDCNDLLVYQLEAKPNPKGQSAINIFMFSLFSHLRQGCFFYVSLNCYDYDMFTV